MTHSSSSEVPRRLVSRVQPRVGVLGAARIVPKALLTPAAGLLEVCAVAARDAERARAFAAAHGIASAHGSYEELLARPDLDAVYIALPASLHAEWTLRALEAGKHVLCEKPFGLAAREARACVDLALERGLLLMEAHHWRYHPLIDAFRDALARLGTITEVSAVFDAPVRGENIRLDPRLGAGVLLDFGCYSAQWLALAAGDVAPEIIEARAEEGAPGVDLRFHASLRAVSGARLHLSCDMRPEVTFVAFIEVVGDTGRVRFENPLNGEDARLIVTSTGETPVLLDALGPSTFRRQLERFVRALRDGSEPETSGESIVHTQALLDRLYLAAGLPARDELARRSATD